MQWRHYRWDGPAFPVYVSFIFDRGLVHISLFLAWDNDEMIDSFIYSQRMTFAPKNMEVARTVPTLGCIRRTKFNERPRPESDCKCRYI